MQAAYTVTGIYFLLCAGEFFRFGTVTLKACHCPYMDILPYALAAVGAWAVLHNANESSPSK